MDRVAWIILGSTVAVLIGVIFLASRTVPQAQSYEPTDERRPIATVDQQVFDLGVIRQQDEPTVRATVRNTGQSPLVLSEPTTSCDCTYLSVSLPDGTTSPEFNMHTARTWQGTIDPGQSATITLTYRPRVMPVTGPVSRSALIKTNDPNLPALQFTISADVQ